MAGEQEPKTTLEKIDDATRGKVVAAWLRVPPKARRAIEIASTVTTVLKLKGS